MRETTVLERAASPKQQLQEYAQALHGAPPDYVVLAERGQAHARAFLIQARMRNAEGELQSFPSAWGRTRKEAERWAAHEALLVLHPKN